MILQTIEMPQNINKCCSLLLTINNNDNDNDIDNNYYVKWQPYKTNKQIYKIIENRIKLTFCFA